MVSLMRGRCLIASMKYAIDLGAVLGPLLHLVVVAVVGDLWLVGFFVRQIAHQGAASLPPVNKHVRVKPRLGATERCAIAAHRLKMAAVGRPANAAGIASKRGFFEQTSSGLAKDN
jgi:hypothetical protein